MLKIQMLSFKGWNRLWRVRFLTAGWRMEMRLEAWRTGRRLWQSPGEWWWASEPRLWQGGRRAVKCESSSKDVLDRISLDEDAHWDCRLGAEREDNWPMGWYYNILFYLFFPCQQDALAFSDPFPVLLLSLSFYSSSSKIWNITIHMGLYHHTLSYQMQDSGHKQKLRQWVPGAHYGSATKITTRTLNIALQCHFFSPLCLIQVL